MYFNSFPFVFLAQFCPGFELLRKVLIKKRKNYITAKLLNVKESPLTILSASAREETEMRIVHNFLFLCMENNRNKTCMSVEYYCVHLLKVWVGLGGGI